MLRALVILSILVGCSRSEHRQAVVLRISTHAGLAPLTAAVQGTFSQNLADLVYPVVWTWFASAERHDRFVVLTPRPDNTIPLSTFVRAAKHPAMSSIAIKDGKLVVEFADEASARLFKASPILFELGPYRIQSTREGELVLRRHASEGPGPDLIDVVAMQSEEEEWRRLLAGDVDMVGFVNRSGQAHLADVESVRIIPMHDPGTVAFHFGFGPTSPTSSELVRRAISLGIRRRSIAASAAGDAELARSQPEDVEEAARLLTQAGYGPHHRLRLRTILPASSDELKKVAQVADEQLSPLGIDLAITPLELDEVQPAMIAHDFDVLVFYGDFTPYYFRYFRSGFEANLGGYSNPDFDGATSDAAAVKVLERDLPATPLYSSGLAIAIDRRFCGARPVTLSDFTWLTNVHPCRPGETE